MNKMSKLNIMSKNQKYNNIQKRTYIILNKRKTTITRFVAQGTRNQTIQQNQSQLLFLMSIGSK